MTRKININDFLDLVSSDDEAVVIDVRSPREYQHAHIPNATSLPLFSDEERARVGTCYKQDGHDDAVLLGLEIVGPKMRALAERLVELAGGHTPILHCWRGGMRSQSMAWLAEQVGLQPLVLDGGYKSYRRAACAEFEVERPMIVLSGMTGAGKTTMLYELQSAGEQILDLEGLANHRGSSFGALGLPPQPTVEQFENDLYWNLRQLDPSRPIWVEDESPSIGKVRVPHEFWLAMRSAPAIFLDVDRETRSRNLVAEYGELNVVGLEEAARRLERKLGGPQLRRILDFLANGDMFRVAFELLEYYDKTYRHAATKKPREHVYSISGDLCADRLILFSREECAVL